MTSEAPATALAADKLTHTQIAALRRVMDKEPMAWCVGGRGGGATSRMFRRLTLAGYVTAPPHKITAKGRAALATRGTP